MRKVYGVNTLQRNSKRTRNVSAKALRALAARPVAAVVIVVLLAAIVVFWMLSSGRAESQSQPLAEVKRGPLTISISESGSVKSREKVILKSEVEGRTTILSLIPEGTHVAVGDLLVELDSSQLEEQKVSQQITVLNAEASFIRARENLEVTKSQGASDIARAELDYRFAQLDLDKYLQGEYPKQLQQTESSITLASEEQQRAADELDWSQKLAAEGYITRTELRGDELAKKRADLNFDQARTDLKLLNDYTYTRQVAKLQSDVEQTQMALDRVKRKASADLVQAEADFKARESEFNRQKTKLDKTNDQIAKCRVTAPVEGMVVYATTGRADRRGSQEPLAEGQEIRERQELIYLPTASAMIAEIRVQESSLRKVAVGLPVRITVDALPGRVFYGTVAKIGLLPDAQSVWLNPDLTVYSTEINLQGDMEDLRPGMTCRAEIIVERYDDALSVPVQAVTRIAGKPTVYVKAASGIEPRAIEVGLDNNRVIRVTAGLEAGQLVSLTPPLEPASLGPQGEGGADAYADMPESLRLPPAPAPAVAAQEPQAAPAAGTVDPSQLRSMSPEERRKFFENMTDEERQAMRSQFGGQRGPGRGQRGGPGGQGPQGEAGSAPERPAPEGTAGGAPPANPPQDASAQASQDKPASPQRAPESPPKASPSEGASGD